MPELNRRELLLAGAATALSARRPGAAEQTLKFRLVETAGLRRFGYPIHAVFPGIHSGVNFRLSQNGKAIPAQFRPITGADGQPGVALDFNVNLDPLATQILDVTHGDNVQPGPEPTRGLNVEELEHVFRVSGAGMTYEIPRNSVGFLKRAGSQRNEYVRGDSRGFWLQTSEQGAEERQGTPLRGVVSRKGPLAVGLQSSGTWPLDGDRKVKVTVELTFPASKSWVEAAWSVDDREHGRLLEMGLDLDLALEGAPTLVDFGANGTVYGTIKDTESLWMNAGPEARWQVHKSAVPSPVLLATTRTQRGDRSLQPAEGWAHAMDATRCTAIAVADFGRGTNDRIEIAANGRVRLIRRFPAHGPGLKRMKAWFHFVGMPVQVGALTSPQSMLAPPDLEWL